MAGACAGYSSCRVQFTPNDPQGAERNYSDRSIIELRQYDFATYSLRALDIEKKIEKKFLKLIWKEKININLEDLQIVQMKFVIKLELIVYG